MKWLNSSNRRLRAGISLAVVSAAVYIATIVLVSAADTKTAGTKAPDAKPADVKTADVESADTKTINVTPEKELDPKPETKAPVKFTGAELYAINCNRCHSERYPTERTDAQWQTIMLHMRTRAQLPGKDAKAILKYLQENN